MLLLMPLLLVVFSSYTVANNSQVVASGSQALVAEKGIAAQSISPVKNIDDYLERYLRGEPLLSLEQEANRAGFSIERNAILSEVSAVSTELNLALRDFVASIAGHLQLDGSSFAIATAGFKNDLRSLKPFEKQFIQLKAQHLLYLHHISKVSSHLQQHGHIDYLQELEQQREAYLANIQPLLQRFDDFFKTIDSLSTSNNWLQSFKNTAVELPLSYQLSDVVSELLPLVQEHAPAILRAAVLPVRTLDQLPKVAAKSPSIVASYQQQALISAQTEDYAEAGEVKFSPEILAKAEQLDYDAAKIYAFVRNEIRTEWYFGAMKGAAGTLLQGAGNDIDQSALLISLLRASSVPARFVRGVVKIPIRKRNDKRGLQELMGVDNNASALNILKHAGIPYSLELGGGGVSAVEIDYTWVSAQITYSNYRGVTIDRSDKKWFPLMASLEEISHPSLVPLSVVESVDLDALRADYLQARLLEAPLAHVKSTMDTALIDQASELSHLDFLRSEVVESRPQVYVPNSLPVAVTVVRSESALLADEDRHWVQFNSYASTQPDSPILSLKLPLSAVASKRVTLSYVAGTADSQNVINSFGGLGQVPAYLVELRPQIKVDGLLKATGSEVLPMADEHLFELSLISPSGTEKITKRVYAGSYHAVGIVAQDVVLNQATVLEGDTEGRAAGLLSQLALRYQEKWNREDRALAQLTDVKLVKPLPSVTFVSNELEIERVLGQPQQLGWRGVSIDAALRVTEAVLRRNTGNVIDLVAWRKFSALQGSFWEHRLMEQDFSIAAISADKGIALAVEQGIEIFTIDSSNAAALLLQLSHPQSVIDDINFWLSAGFVVTVPSQLVSLESWQGSAWIVSDSNTGASGYFISGGLAGGSSSSAPGTWPADLETLLSQPYLSDVNGDSTAGVTVTKFEGADAQFTTVGTVFGSEVLVVVEDAKGNRVSGAPVTFLSNGTATFGGDETITVLTDGAGIASASVEAGESTATAPYYVKLDKNDEHPSRVGLNTVDAYVGAPEDFVEGVTPGLVEPFVLWGEPGEPEIFEGGLLTIEEGEIVLVLEEPNRLFAEGAYQVANFIVKDTFGNPVSNADITAASLPGEVIAFSPSTGEPTRVVVQDAVTLPAQQAGTCLPTLSYRYDCGDASLTVKSQPINNQFVIINGFSERIEGIASLNETAKYSVLFTAANTSLQLSINGLERDSGFARFNLNDVCQSDGGNASCVAGQAGQSFKAPLRLTYEFSVPATATDTSLRDDIVQTDIEFESIGSIDVLSTAIVDEQFVGDALVYREYEVWLAASGPGEGGFDVEETRWYPSISDPEQLTPRSTGKTTYSTMYSVALTAADLASAIDLDLEGAPAANTPIQFAYQPADYKPLGAAVIIYENDEPFLVKSVSTENGQGSATIGTNYQYNLENEYSYQVYLNYGTNFEIKSERKPLAFNQPVIARLDRRVELLAHVQASQSVCTPEASINFTVTQEASVTLGIDGAADNIIDNEVFAVGSHTIELPTDVLLEGIYNYTLTATSNATSNVEEQQGVIVVSNNYLDNLPISHTTVQGVNVFGGQLGLSSTDISVSGKGPDLELRRSYSSQAGQAGPMGMGWDHNYHSYIAFVGCGTYTVSGGDTGAVIFTETVGSEGSVYSPASGHFGTLIQSEGEFDFYSKDGTRYHYKAFTFSAEDRWELEYIQDANGNVTSLAYNPSSRPGQPELSAVQDISGRLLNFQYDEFDTIVGPRRLITQADVLSSQIIYQYDGLGRLVDANVRHKSNSYSESYSYVIGSLAQINSLETFVSRVALSQAVNRRGHSTDYTSQVFNVYKTTDPLGGFTARPFYTQVSPPGFSTYSFSYGELDRFPAAQYTTDVSAPRGASSYTMNNYGSVTGINGPAGTQSFAWNGILLSEKTDERGITTTFEYDAFGNATREKVGATPAIERAYKPPGAQYIKNLLASETNRRGGITAYDYDSAGNLIEKTYPDGVSERYNYTSDGLLKSFADRDNAITTYAYNNSGYVTTTNLPIGTIKNAWNNVGHKISEITPSGNTISFDRDGFGNALKMTDSVGIQRFSYDNNNNKTSETNERGAITSWVYDEANRITSQTVSGLGTKSLGYNSAGDLTSETDFRGTSISYGYTAAGYQSSVSKDALQISRLFDAVGNVTSETIGGNTTGFTYDDLNRVTQIVDPEGGTTVYVRDDNGNITSITDAEGRQTVIVYDAVDRETSRTTVSATITTGWGDLYKQSVTDRNGVITTFRYDSMGRVTSESHPATGTRSFKYEKDGSLAEETNGRNVLTKYSNDARGRRTSTMVGGYTTAFVYDVTNNLISETLPNGNTLARSYDITNRLTLVTDSLGLVERFTYDENSNITSRTDANDDTTTFAYNANDLVTEESRPIGTITTSYDSALNISSRTDLNGGATTFTYDGLKRVTSETDPESNGMSFAYDKVGNKTSETDKNGNITNFVYNDLDYLTSITDAVGTQSFQRDANGNATVVTDRRGIVTSNSYDQANRLERSERSGVTLLDREYDKEGNLVRETDANGHVSAFVYDDRNFLTTESRPLSAVTRYQRDASGNIERLTDPEGRATSRGYNPRNFMTLEVAPAGTSTFTYDGLGNRTSQTRPASNAWQFDYDENSRLVSVDVSGAGTTRYDYDDNGNLTGQTTGGKTTTFGYDSANRRTDISYADGATFSFGHDGNGNITSIGDPNGNSIILGYDALNRETSRSYNVSGSVSNNIQSVTTTYDKNSNIQSVSESFAGLGGRSTTMDYDSLDRLVSKTDGFGKRISYDYDNNGNRTRVTDPDGKITTYAYDGLNRPTAVLNNNGATGYSYDRTGLVQSVNYPNSTQASYVYDSAGRLINIDNTQNGATVSSYAYSYDANSNRTQQIEINGGAAETTSYDYDSADRLTQVIYPDITVSYSYDASFNRTGETEVDNATSALIKDLTLSYNSRDQLTDITDTVDSVSNNVTYSYDANGNQTQKIKASVTTDFVYDARDNLREVTTGGSTVGQFLYDYQALRVEKIGDRGTERYSYDDQSVLVQFDETGSTIAKYDYGPNRLLSLNHATKGLQFYLMDGLNSVVNLTNTSGAVQARYQYDAWGNKRNEVGSSFNRFSFTGYEEDTETGLLYAKARFYDPDTGRFLSHDPFEGEASTPPSLHRYLYAFGNPTVFVDPTGEVAVCRDGDSFSTNCSGSAEVAGDTEQQLSKEQIQNRNAKTSGVTEPELSRNEQEISNCSLDPSCNLFELDRQQQERANRAFANRQQEQLNVESDAGPLTTQEELQNTRNQIRQAQGGALVDAAKFVGVAAATVVIDQVTGKKIQKGLEKVGDAIKAARRSPSVSAKPNANSTSGLTDDEAAGVAAGKFGVPFSFTDDGIEKIVEGSRGGIKNRLTVGQRFLQKKVARPGNKFNFEKGAVPTQKEVESTVRAILSSQSLSIKKQRPSSALKNGGFKVRADGANSPGLLLDENFEFIDFAN